MKICRTCGRESSMEELRKSRFICPGCGQYFRIPAKERINMVVDKDSFKEWYPDLTVKNPLQTEGYEDEIKKASEKSGMNEGILIGQATVMRKNIAIGVMDADFMMGSMGHVVGEKVTLMFEAAMKNSLPVFLFCCSGGARMQEGLVSLMQMEKTAAAVARHSKKGLFYCSVLTDPTTGGVTASFATLGDVIIAEPGATIGFAGKRVIRQTMGKELPDGFQTAEFMEEHGMVDGITERRYLRNIMFFMILVNQKKQGYNHFDNAYKKSFHRLSDYNFFKLFQKAKTPWERVRSIRQISYPSSMKYIRAIFDIFVELKGDRVYREDRAVIGGIAMLDGQPVTVIATHRGHDTQEFISRNFGMPMPEGYRKAMRLMRQAEKFGRPIITFINTPGAYCGIGAEERGQGGAIARNLYEMSELKVPVLSIIIGEAGSGGALALAVGNEVWMLANATYSILTPEGYASILWKDASRAEEAANKMHITAQELQKLGVIDKIIPDYGGASDDTVNQISMDLKKHIIAFLNDMTKKTEEEIISQRYEHFRKF